MRQQPGSTLIIHHSAPLLQQLLSPRRHLLAIRLVVVQSCHCGQVGQLRLRCICCACCRAGHLLRQGRILLEARLQQGAQLQELLAV
jgi:hypothetical protein